MCHYRPLISFILICVAATSLLAQQHPISNGDVDACDGVLEDSGGPSGSYENGEDFTATICSDGIAAPISLNFVIFDLSTSGFAPIDRLVIYDGATINAPVIGIFTGDEAMNAIVTASQSNPSGCLTLNFRSNGSGVGDFAATISCGSSCTQPTASWAASTPDTVRLCVGEELVLDATPSQAANGLQLVQYAWTWGQSEGAISANAVDTIAFQQPGAYAVRLQVTDETGCSATAGEVVLALVSGPPSFTGTSSPTATCIGSTITLHGVATPIPLDLTQQPCFEPLAPHALPDDVGTTHELPVTIASASDTATIHTAEDVGDICLTMEHSFMGDLVIELVCPNGQSAMLHQQGGGGTFLGEADDLSLDAPGICWTYCFTSDAVNGTWVDHSQVGDALIPVPNGNALEPGDYSPVQPFTELIGCPVNGAWTVRITDLWAADNGYLCNWCSDLGTTADTSHSTYAPTLDLNSPDLAFWSGNGVNNGPGADATTLISTSSDTAFTFTVIDPHGCTYDTTLVTHIIEPFQVDAGPDLTLCADTAQLNTVVIPASDCIYTLVLSDLASDGWNGGAHLEVILDDDTTTYAPSWGPISQEFPVNVSTGTTITLNYTAGTVWNDENAFSLLNADGTVLYTSIQGPPTGTTYSGTADCGEFGGQLVQWTPATGLSDASILDPLFFPNQSGWYVVEVSIEGSSTCTGTDSVWVETGASAIDLAWNESDSVLCTSADTLASYAWWNDGTLITTTTSPCLQDPGAGSWSVVGEGMAPCPYASDAVLICPEIALTYSDGQITALGAAGLWSWTWNEEALTTTGPIIDVSGTGTYEATVTTSYGCTATASIEVEIPTSIVSHGTDDAFIVFPVPSNGTLTIRTAAVTGLPATITLLDMTGRQVYGERISRTGSSGDHTFSPDLGSGCYLLIWEQSGLRSTARVVIR